MPNGWRSRSMAAVRAWTMFGSGKNSKPENCLTRSGRRIPAVQPFAPHTECDGVHAWLGNLPAYQNAGLLKNASPEAQIDPETNRIFKRFSLVDSCRQCNRSREFQAML
jgi:hypothetical protein